MKSPTKTNTFLVILCAILTTLSLPHAHADQSIVVTVPATSIIWVDANGYIQRTTSNSEGDFQPGDQLYIFDQNNNLIYQPPGE